jgi:hypothetical protein
MTKDQALQELRDKYFEHPYAGYVKVSDVKQLIVKIFDDFDANNKTITKLVHKAETLVKEIRENS